MYLELLLDVAKKKKKYRSSFQLTASQQHPLRKVLILF